MQGRLGDTLIGELMGELAQNKTSGLLRLSKGKVIKAIFFDSGNPIFAISNLADEQLDQALIKRGYATPEQIEQAKQKQGKASQLGSVLVQMGTISDQDLKTVVRELIMQIILSLFEWDQGEYVLDERVRAAHEIQLERDAEECLLAGARHAAECDQIARAMLPTSCVVLQVPSNGSRLDSLSLTSIESYVFSRLDTPTKVEDVGSLAGIPDDEARRALCTLISVGLVKRLGHERPVNGADGTSEADESAERMREEVSRKLHFFQSADFYEVLGVTKRASSAEIKSAYYQLAKKFHPDVYRQGENVELRSKLEALFAKISQAYETLSDGAQRAAYDDRIKNTSGQSVSVGHAESITPSHTKEREVTVEGETGASSNHVAEDQAAPAVASSSAVPPGQQAEFYYQQGRKRYDAKDYYAAVQLLREAVKLDPKKPQFHFHLGIALVQNPRTRRDGEAHLLKAAELDKFSAQIRVRLGLLYKEAGLAKKAEGYFKEALSMDPENRTAQRELGVSGGKGKKGDQSAWKSDLGSIAKKLFKK